jgi:hypothetical protein
MTKQLQGGIYAKQTRKVDLENTNSFRLVVACP